MKAFLPNKNNLYVLVVLAFLSNVLLFKNQSILYPIILIGFALSNVVLSDSTKFAVKYSRSTHEQSPENELKIKQKLGSMYVTVNSFLATFTLFHVTGPKINSPFKISSVDFFALSWLTLKIVLVSTVVEALVIGVHSVIREHI